MSDAQSIVMAAVEARDALDKASGGSGSVLVDLVARCQKIKDATNPGEGGAA